MDQHSYMLIMMIALIILSIFKMIRRNIGWQPLNQGLMLFRIVLFFSIGLIFLVEGVFHPISFISDVVGILLGSILAFYSVSVTHFEQREKRLYYRPNIWIGSIVILLFLVRFIYRFYGIVTGGALDLVQQKQANGIQNFSSVLGNSWTAGLMLIMFAYYSIYYILLLKKQRETSKNA
ncbi:CcdC protein domain-containing protein [Neobacillus thermocopriae]|uniref:DUF1453 family protein n=1 Tax=Neobacillus thermocopriae TaxID=1215031 RepID=A0A6B3TTA4_9BACI|nr:CcdC protein domain-containing protein [Neobacillus thermocopriae]MED3622934.1 DUF1453 family protein [Neobacillus thermocopriae]MED3713208.1 DUF1453 family protein [Neobacillus thermocopriae]NEX79231.1 DUF1453 family protein [Neobacillus thermocopriae]